MEKILIPDDYDIISSGLRSLIGDFLADLQTEEVFDRTLAPDKVKRNKYGLIFLYGMPNSDSRELVSDILTIDPSLKILMLGMQPEHPLLKKYLQAGVAGILSRDPTEPDIKNAIDNILDDKIYISPNLLDFLLRNMVKNPFDNLPSRELQLVLSLINGESIDAISDKMDIHARTIKTLITKVFEKLGCKDIAELNSLANTYDIVQMNH